MEIFGVLDLATIFEGCRFAIGVRNANNKRFWLAYMVPAASLRVSQSRFKRRFHTRANVACTYLKLCTLPRRSVRTTTGCRRYAYACFLA
jgi:hypothetical protein